jgi:hypothetical protein
VVLLLAFVVSRSCQTSQIRLTKDQAIARAEQQVDFEATSKQVRLLRQGVGAKPYWIVSLSVPRKGKTTFSELAVIRINANTGKVADVKVQR